MRTHVYSGWYKKIMISIDHFVCLNVDNTNLLRIVREKNAKNSAKSLYRDTSR